MQSQKIPRGPARPANGTLSPARFRDRRQAETSAACVAARDEERRRLAREIHDDLGSELTALRFALARLATLSPHAVDPCTGPLADAEAALNAAFDASRRLIDERTAPSNACLHDQLGNWIESFGKRIGMTIPFDIKVDVRLDPVDDETAHALLRITQEALNNMAKHAQASEATVRLTIQSSGVLLLIRDNGRGLGPGRARPVQRHSQATPLTTLYATPAASGSGVGLQGMRERCEALNGSLELNSRPGSGVEIRVTLPWRGRPPQERRSSGSMAHSSTAGTLS